MAEPKYRTVKIPKPRSRGIRGKMALQKWQRSGGRQKQILNPETGKYVPVLFGESGRRQLQKFYPTKERGESIKKVEKAKVAQAKRNKAGAAEAKKKAEALLAETKKKRKDKEAKAKREAAKPKAEPKLPAVTAADNKAQLASIFEKGRAERGSRSEPAPPSVPVAKDNKFKELLDKIDAEGGKLADLPPLPSRPTAPQPVTEITADSPPPTTGRLTRGPGSEAPLPPPRIRITEEAPKPPMVDLAELPIRDQVELNTVLKDLKNRVISPDFKTPTQAEIAEAVTKATGGKFTPPVAKVAEPPPPKAEPVVPAPTGGMSSVVKRDGEDASAGLGKLLAGFGGGQTKTTITPTELAAKAQQLREAAADPKTSSSKLSALAKDLQAATRGVQKQTAEKQAKAKTADEIRADAAAIVAARAGEPPSAVPTTPSVVTPDELRAMAKRLTEAAADPSTTTSELMALNKQVQEATKQLQDQTSQRQAERQAQTGKTDEEILAEAKAIVAGMGPTPTPATPVDSGGTFMPMPGEPPPRDAPPREAPPAAPPQPRFVNMDPLQGVRETYVPTNILGSSYDPNVREDYVQKMMQAGANIQQGGYPAFQMPTSAVPQVQFGGYGAPVPMAPLAPYAGLAAPPQPYSGAIVNPGTGEPEPVGAAPIPGMVTNLPPGVTGPIR